MNMQSVMTLAFVLALLTCHVAVAAEQKPSISGIQSPVGMIYDKEGNLFVAEWGAGKVSCFDAEGKRTVVTEAIRGPSGLTLDNHGNLYVASYTDGAVYIIEKGQDPRKLASGFSSPAGLLWGQDNILLVANRNAGEIVKLHSDGKKEVISRNHKTPVGLAQKADGSLFVSCLNGGIDLIRPDGTSSTINTNLRNPAPGIILDNNDSVLVADYGGTSVIRVNSKGEATTAIDGLSTPVGLARRPDGRVIVGTWGDNAAFIFTVQ